MSPSRIFPALLLALAGGCGDESPGPSIAELSHATLVPSDLPEPLQFDPARNFVAEYEQFLRMVNKQHADPATIREALAVAPSAQFDYTTVDGKELRGWEFKVLGPRPEAPFFEAFAAGYPGQSFYVFFEKSWFSWRALECGFHVPGVFEARASLP